MSDSPFSVIEKIHRATGGGIFPSTLEIPGGGTLTTTGLTKRDLYAALAMHGMLSDSGGDQPSAQLVSALAVGYADALLAQLESPQ